MKRLEYRLLNGDLIDLRGLSKQDLVFLLDLQRRALADENYFELELSVCGKGAYPLKGSLRVTLEIHDTPLFRVAEDVADIAGIRQGYLAPEKGDPTVRTEKMLSVTQAARRLGITRSAVIKAARTGRLKGTKVGRTWVLLERSVRDYKVASYRVEAGKAAWISAAR